MPFSLRRPRCTESTSSRSLNNVTKGTIYVSEIEDDGKYDYFSRYEKGFSPTSARRTLSRRVPTSRRANSYISSHRITQIPVELLAHIFLLGSEDDPRFAVVVSHVCRTWRYVALETPSLWRHISPDMRSSMWTERMHRAKACTLDVDLRPRVQVSRRTFRRNYLDARSVEAYMHLVNPYIPHWRSLRIEFQHYAPYLWNAALSGCCGNEGDQQAPNIEELTLVHPLNDDPKEFLLFSGCAPRLRSATIQGIRLTWLPSLFANLTTLDYTHHGFTRGYEAFLELYCMLRVSSNLRDLRLTFPPRTHHSLGSRYPQMETNALLYMHELRNLTITVSADDIPSCLVQLMSRLRLKGLRSLSLICPAPPAAQTHGRHHREHAPPLPPFSRLRNLLKALPRLPMLAHLRLEHSWVDSHFLSGLLKFHVPQLKHLALASGHVNDAFLWTLGEELRGRNYYVGHLDMDEYVPGVWHNGSVSLSTLDVLEVCEGRVSTDGVVGVVRRMLGGGVLWVKELWLKDCKGTDSEMIERAGRFGVNVRVWANGVELREGETLPSPTSRPSVWRRIYR